MKHLNRSPSHFSISIPPDETGMIGRECPGPSCESNFNIQHAFQKRHLLPHKMGVVDEAYQEATGVSATSIGKRVSISRDDIHELLSVGYYLYKSLEAKS